MRKKVDSRIRTLIENGVKTKHRSFFVIVGDNARDQVRGLAQSILCYIKYFLPQKFLKSSTYWTIYTVPMLIFFQIINLHYILSKSLVKARPNVLWCYKNDMGFSR